MMHKIKYSIQYQPIFIIKIVDIFTDMDVWNQLCSYNWNYWSSFLLMEWIRVQTLFNWYFRAGNKFFLCVYRSLLASRSDSNKVKRSPSRTGPFTFLIICRFCSPRNSTFTCVHCPCEPVLPRTFITRAKTTGLSMIFRPHVALMRQQRNVLRKWKSFCHFIIQQRWQLPAGFSSSIIEFNI